MVPDKEYEGDDPFEFVAMRFPVEPGRDAEAEMARCFIEEYALMGMPRDRMMALFRSPRFQGTHSVLQSHGESFIQQLIDSVYGANPPEVR